MHQWNLVCHTGSSVGNTTTVASRDMRLQSAGVAVKHHTPMGAHYSNRQHQYKIISKKQSRKSSFSLYKVLLAIYKVL